jgi:2-keto-4-pentenoate hydratase
VPVSEIDPRLMVALAAQLDDWYAALDAGARRVGWKLGVGERERIGPGPVIGHLTSATQLAPGIAFDSESVRSLHADAEVAVRLGRDVGGDAAPEDARAAIAGYGAALELVDLGSPPDDAEGIVAANVFHRAFALGPLDRPSVPPGTTGRLIADGDVRDAAPAAADHAGHVRAAAGLLEAVGERLQAGDVLITGSVVQVPVPAGVQVTADLGALGRVTLGVS